MVVVMVVVVVVVVVAVLVNQSLLSLASRGHQRQDEGHILTCKYTWLERDRNEYLAKLNSRASLKAT